MTTLGIVLLAVACFLLGAALLYLKLNAYCSRIEGKNAFLEIENARLKRGSH